MLNKNMSKAEIEKELDKKGDFVQIDYLTRFLREDLPLDIKKFAYLKLAELYEKRHLLIEAAKMLDALAIISLTFAEKIRHNVKETELYIKAGIFNKADEAMKKAMSNANTTERNEIYISIKEFYKRQAEVYERELRRNSAIKIYEKLLEMKISDLERGEIKNKLLNLYERLGKIKEYSNLKKLR